LLRESSFILVVPVPDVIPQNSLLRVRLFSQSLRLVWDEVDVVSPLQFLFNNLARALSEIFVALIHEKLIFALELLISTDSEWGNKYGIKLSGRIV